MPLIGLVGSSFSHTGNCGHTKDLISVVESALEPLLRLEPGQGTLGPSLRLGPR